MRARILFQCAASFALVLSVASTSSHATERRDPLIYQDATQSANSVRGSENAVKPVKHIRKPVKKPQAAKASATAKKTPTADGNSTGSR